MRKTLLIGVVVLIAIVIAAGVFMLTNRKTQPAAPLSPTASASPSPTPLVASHPGEDDHDAGLPELVAAFPAGQHLPYSTEYWSLAVDSREEGDKPVLEATVYVASGEVAEDEITRQRPYIEQWLASVGQPPDTYELRFRTVEGSDHAAGAEYR